jgi:hypothetical protein
MTIDELTGQRKSGLPDVEAPAPPPPPPTPTPATTTANGRSSMSPKAREGDIRMGPPQAARYRVSPHSSK